MALSNIFCKSVLYKKDFYKILLDYCINSRVRNYSKRAMIGPLRTVIIHSFSYFRFKYE